MKIIKYLAIVPARKDSKRIKNKNLIKINNKELIKFTIESAKKIKKIKKIVVSSDDKRILNIAKKYKINSVKRPRKIARDNSTTEQAIHHTYKFFIKNNEEKVKNIILLQPTSPLRNAKHINECINLFEKKRYDSIFSAYKKNAFLWRSLNNKVKSLNYNYKKRIISQKMKKIIYENGAIYIFSSKGFIKYKNRLFGKIGVYYMNRLDSIDIDSIEDVNLVKKII